MSTDAEIRFYHEKLLPLQHKLAQEILLPHLAALHRPGVEKELAAPISQEEISNLAFLGHAMDDAGSEDEASDLRCAKSAQDASLPVPAEVIDRITDRRVSHWADDIACDWLLFLSAWGNAQGGIIKSSDLNSAMLPTLTHDVMLCYIDGGGPTVWTRDADGKERSYVSLDVYDGISRQSLETLRRSLPTGRVLPELAEEHLALQGIRVLNDAS